MFNYLLLVVLIAILIEIYIDNNILEVSEYTIKDKKIGKEFSGFKIVHLSDLHGKSFGKKNARLLSAISKINPDIIVMTGDMINGMKDNHDVLMEFIQSLQGKYPMYYILGNHELNLSQKNQKALCDFLESCDVQVLNNEKTMIQRKQDSISLFGSKCLAKDYRLNGKAPQPIDVEEMKNVMKDAPISDEDYNILLIHNPNAMDAYSKWGADLTLAGHIHGGMVRLPFVGGVFSPDTILFPKYSKGKYMVNGKAMIVSRGLGRGRRGFRLWNRPEIIVITLENEGIEER